MAESAGRLWGLLSVAGPPAGIEVAWLKLIQEQFGVNPWVFAALYVVTLPPGWYGTWRVVGALRRRNQRALLSWTILVGAMVLAPYTYVLIAGRNLPWWFYPVLACFLAVSAWRIARAIRQRVEQRTRPADFT